MDSPRRCPCSPRLRRVRPHPRRPRGAGHHPRGRTERHDVAAGMRLTTAKSRSRARRGPVPLSPAPRPAAVPGRGLHRATRFVPVWAVLALAFAAPAAADAVALTFDDLPVFGTARPVAEQTVITRKLLRGLVRHHLPATGFVNEINLEGPDRPARVALLTAWLDAGMDLGNHTYSHVSLTTTPVADYIADAADGDAVTKALLAARGRTERWFRYPLSRNRTDAGDPPDVRGVAGERPLPRRAGNARELGLSVRRPVRCGAGARRPGAGEGHPAGIHRLFGQGRRLVPLGGGRAARSPAAARLAAPRQRAQRRQHRRTGENRAQTAAYRGYARRGDGRPGLCPARGLCRPPTATSGSNVGPRCFTASCRGTEMPHVPKDIAVESAALDDEPGEHGTP